MTTLPQRFDSAPPNLALQGQWETSTAYRLYDVVDNDGASYICKSGHTSGASTEPGTGESWETVWVLLASKGATGATGATGPQGPAGDGGGAAWTAGVIPSPALTTLTTGGAVLATWNLPSGWMAAGASCEVKADLVAIANASSRLIDLRWQFRASDNSPVFFITGEADTGLSTPVIGQAFQCRLDLHVIDVASGLFLRTATKTTLNVTPASSTKNVEAGVPIGTATKIVLLGSQDSGSDATMSCFRVAGMDTTP